MRQLLRGMYEHEGEEVRERENRARGGKTAYGVAAEQAATLAGAELSDDEWARNRSGGDCLRGVNYFCRSTTTISAGEGLAKGARLATAAALGNGRWPVTGRL